MDMAKKQTRRSISVSRATYERLKSYCETNGMSMSQFVETRVGDFLGRSFRRPQEAASPEVAAIPSAPALAAPPAPAQVIRPVERRPAPPPVKATAESIFTF
jgi:nucleoid-associated protein YgaU